jgi:hypothetical protein
MSKIVIVIVIFHRHKPMDQGNKKGMRKYTPILVWLYNFQKHGLFKVVFIIILKSTKQRTYGSTAYIGCTLSGNGLRDIFHLH